MVCPVNTNLWSAIKGKLVKFLGPATSVLEQTTLARFVGRITADDGLTYGNHFLSSDSIDATATIQVDPAHVGENGFLVTVGLIGQDRFWLDQRGKFVRTAFCSSKSYITS